MRSRWFRIAGALPALALAALLAGCGTPETQTQAGSAAAPQPTQASSAPAAQDQSAAAAAPQPTQASAAPTKPSQSVSDALPNQGSALNQDLLRQVDQALAQPPAGVDAATARTLRDSAVDLAKQGHVEEANGTLKTAAMLLGVLRPAGDTAQSPPLPTIPPAPAVPVAPADAQGATVINATFASKDDLKTWQQVGPKIPIGGTAQWDVADGRLVQRGLEGVEAVDEQTGLVTGDPSWKDVTVRAAVLAQGTKEVGLIVRQNNGENYYRFRALALGTQTNQGNLILEKVIDGKVTQIAAFDGPELSADTWHTLALSAKGNTITALVDGKQVGSANDTSLTSGRAGVSTLAMSGAYFANVQVIGR